MTIQPPLFGGAHRRQKAVAETSLEAYAEVRARLGERQLTVLKALNSYHSFEKAWPTSYELLEWMRKWRPEYDLNFVRPRLTEMRGDDLRFVRKGERRKCRITSKFAREWEVTERGEAYLRGQK